MPSLYEALSDTLTANPRSWLITGVAGFIGSNLLERLLLLGQHVRGLDNFATGHRRNLDDVRRAVGEAAWHRFRFIEGDITDTALCLDASQGIDYVLHQAALGSVPRSIQTPLLTNRANVDGFLTVLEAAQKAKVKRFVYASSSSVYGDHPALPKEEDKIGRPLSPYAVTKRTNELYAEAFARTHRVECIGLRYFNVFGRRQDPAGAYAAVIPRWIGQLLDHQAVQINGDGETSRDFCYVENVIQANLLAATTPQANAIDQVYNIAVGQRTTLNQLYQLIGNELSKALPQFEAREPDYQDFRSGDIRHSHASIAKATSLLGYQPTHTIEQGLQEAIPWYVQTLHATPPSQKA